MEGENKEEGSTPSTPGQEPDQPEQEPGQPPEGGEPKSD